MTGKELATKMLDVLIGHGASEAEVYLEEGDRLNIQVRQGKIEYLKQESFRGMGMRVYVDGRLSFVDTADFDSQSLEMLADKAVKLAQIAEYDPANGLPQPKGQQRSQGLVDKHIHSMTREQKVDRLLETERLAMEYHPSITLSNGASYTDMVRMVMVTNTHGLSHSYEETRFSTDVSVVATKDGHKKDGWDSCQRRAYRFLRAPAEMAKIAGQMAVSLVGGEPVSSVEVPVVFQARAGRGLVGGLAEAVNGKEVHQGRSFLADKLGQTMASELVTIVDDGTLLNGVGSAPVDGEGVIAQRKVIVNRGVLQAYLYDSYGARKAGVVSTGNGIRGSYRGLPSIGATNFYMEQGKIKAPELISGIKQGLYVQETIGFGANATTGGYSAGIFGRWIENGQLTQPVAEVTIAGHLLEIFMSIDAVADDLDFDGRICCPSFRVSHMTVAGK